jgi:hypothetical protein
MRRTGMHKLEIRFPGEALASYRDNRGVVYSLFYRSDDEHYVVHYDDPSGPAWLEDGCGNGLSAEDVRRGWPELAKAARLN